MILELEQTILKDRNVLAEKAWKQLLDKSRTNQFTQFNLLQLDQTKFLKEELEVKISFYEEKPISIELPKQITCKIKSTDAALKGQTVSSSYKPAILDNGVKIQVPPFIESGDQIIVDTRLIEYVKKI